MLVALQAGGALAGAESARPAPAGSARDRFHKAQSFVTYYGADKVDQLAGYDIAIIHTPQMSRENVKKLRDRGVIVIGYLAVGQDHELQTGDGRGPAGKAGWYFDGDRDGQPDQDPVWKSWYANANDDLWRASRVARAKQLVNSYGCDGVFLDVISVSEMYPECRPGMIQLMHELREALPENVILMNQGFDIVGDVAALADGLMIESFTATYDFNRKEYELNSPSAMDFHLRRAQKILVPEMEAHGLRILVLDYVRRDDRDAMTYAANRAASVGFLFSAAPIMLDEVYADIPEGKADPKWLGMHATPEKLSLQLKENRNGFPAGTVLKPSGCFAGYTVEPLVNSDVDRSQLHWAEAAWASAEDGDPQWIQFDLPEQRTDGSLTIDWHGKQGTSRHFAVQIRESDAAPWRDAATVRDNDSGRTTHRLPDQEYKQLRIYQEGDGGSLARPKLMWIARVAIAD